MDLSRVHVILLRTRNAQNLGAVARAMKNFGLSRLTLVQPHTGDLPTARAVAVHAQDVLAAMRHADTLEAALGDAAWVVGTSSRRLPGQRDLGPREVAEHARTLDGELALVFGDEESGLSNDELLRCHDATTIPTTTEQPSLNLAQAVLTYAYELHLAARGPAVPASERAGERALIEVEASLRALLDAAAFADPDRPGHGVRELSHALRRAGLTPAEARLWQAVLRRAEKKLRER